MIIKIRNGVFETNSSSTHSFTLGKTREISYINSLDVKTTKQLPYVEHYYLNVIQKKKQEEEIIEVSHYFGWEPKRYNHPLIKIEYLYHFIKKSKKKIEILSNLFYEKTQRKLKFAVSDGMIDHQSLEDEDLINQIFELFTKEKLLDDFIFNSNSWLITDNDNRDWTKECHELYTLPVYERDNKKEEIKSIDTSIPIWEISFLNLKSKSFEEDIQHLSVYNIFNENKKKVIIYKHRNQTNLSYLIYDKNNYEKALNNLVKSKLEFYTLICNDHSENELSDGDLIEVYSCFGKKIIPKNKQIPYEFVELTQYPYSFVKTNKMFLFQEYWTKKNIGVEFSLIKNGEQSDGNKYLKIKQQLSKP